MRILQIGQKNMSTYFLKTCQPYPSRDYFYFFTITENKPHFTMSYSKADQFPTNHYLRSIWCKVQAHPARIKILEFILQHQHASFWELNLYVNELAPTTVSQHIDYLLKHDIIQIQEKNPKAVYKLNGAVCNDLNSLLTEFSAQFRCN